jgi:serine/threonine protein kinase
MAQNQKKKLRSKVFGGTYTECAFLGQGMQSKVYQFVHRDEQGKRTMSYACKLTSNRYLEGCDPEKSRKRWHSMVRELVLLELIDSPHVVKVHEFIRTRHNFYMVQDYANGGSLQNLLNLHKCFPESIAKKILKQIIQGCCALYEKQVVHRDLKLDNCLIHFPN